MWLRDLIENRGRMREIDRIGIISQCRNCKIYCFEMFAAIGTGFWRIVFKSPLFLVNGLYGRELMSRLLNPSKIVSCFQAYDSRMNVQVLIL